MVPWVNTRIAARQPIVHTHSSWINPDCDWYERFGDGVDQRHDMFLSRMYKIDTDTITQLYLFVEELDFNICYSGSNHPSMKAFHRMWVVDQN